MEPVQGEPWPAARSGHGACCLNCGEDHPKLLLSGGVGKNNKLLGDMWILDVNSGKWTEVCHIVFCMSLAVHILCI